MKNALAAYVVSASAISALCASCTIIYSHPPPKSPLGSRILGGIGYSVHDRYFDSSPRVHDNDRHSLFVNAVKQALQDSGYNSPVLLTEDEALAQNAPRLKLTVIVEVLSDFYDYGHAAAPQEWLTGLSLGLIPSWATRHELKLTFELQDGEASIRRWEYMPESLWINHLIFFPIAIFHMDSRSDYKRQSAQVAAATRYFVGEGN